MPRMADLIKVTRKGRTATLEIDGVEFPWYIAEAGVEVDVDTREAPTVTITVLAERVELVNDLLPVRPGEPDFTHEDEVPRETRSGADFGEHS